MAYIGSAPSTLVSRESSRVYTYTATAGQTVFTGADVNNQVLSVTPSDTQVHMNGLLLDATDYTVTSSSVTLVTAANAGDELTVTGMVTFEVADTYDKTTADARYVNAAGDTMTGALALPAAGLTVGTDQLAVDSAGRVTMPYQPMYSTRGTNYTQATGSWSIVKAATVDINIGSHYNASTGAFTAPIAGRYLFNVNGLIYPSNATSVITASWAVNGALWSGTQSGEADTDHMNYSNSVVLNLSANDSVTFQLIRYSGSGYAYASQWNMYGYLIG